MSAQNIQGVVTDSLTNEPIPYLSVFYEGKGVGSITDNDGNYKVETRKGWNKLTFSAVGYVTKVVNIIPGVTKNLNVRMRPDDIMLDEVVVKPKREKYSRKNNPAVELMKKVIAHKKNNKLSENDYYQYNKYQKITMSLNDVTPEMLEKGMYKKMPFLKDQIELCEETNKFILPISVDETASQKIYRKHPKSEKTIIKGMSSTGVNELFATGDMLSTVLKDVFTDVNIYDNDIRLLQYPFISPISSSDAISFYKFYIMDTTFVDKDKCFHLTFVPNNSQDFGFTGHLYVLADSSYTVKKCTMNLPKKSGVNFVDNMDIIQEFEQLPNGEWVLKTDDMIVEMTLMKIMQGFQIRRTTRYSDYAFDELPQQLFKRKGAEIKEADAMMRGDDFWNQYRPVPLTQTESSMDMLVKRLEQMPEGLDVYLYKDYEDGVEISGGEAQKIAIARALCKDAPFILLDEPTAALDPISEYEIYRGFDRIAERKTAIYISHRLSSCRFCEKIAVFHEGRIVQTGSHEALLKDEGGKYLELWNAQAQYYQ